MTLSKGSYVNGKRTIEYLRSPHPNWQRKLLVAVCWLTTRHRINPIGRGRGKEGMHLRCSHCNMDYVRKEK